MSMLESFHEEARLRRELRFLSWRQQISRCCCRPASQETKGNFFFSYSEAIGEQERTKGSLCSAGKGKVAYAISLLCWESDGENFILFSTWELLRYNVQFFGKALWQELRAEACKQTDLPANEGPEFFGIDPCIRGFQTEPNV